MCASRAELQAGGAASSAKPPGEALAEVVAAAALAVNMVSFGEFVTSLGLSWECMELGCKIVKLGSVRDVLLMACFWEPGSGFAHYMVCILPQSLQSLQDHTSADVRHNGRYSR